LHEVEKKGVYNFFYLQRFGAPRYNNFHRAYLILTGHYKQAVKQFFVEESDRDLLYFTEIRRKLRAVFGDVEKMSEILSSFTIQFEYERLMIDYLRRNPEDYLGALKLIPDQTTLWMYALSSWLYNKELSRLIQAGGPIPEALPGFLSRNTNDYDVYKDTLVSNDIYPPPFNNLRPFPGIYLKHSETKTISKVEIKYIENKEEGIHLNFTLDKGQYATTFLSHVFTLVSNRDREKEVFAHVLLNADHKQTLDYFIENLYNKTDNKNNNLIL
jgi:tRNA(Glu) U13 pseudouridine synthase TruD